MKIFLTSDLFTTFAMRTQLEEVFTLLHPQVDLVYTTNRMQDEIFIEYLLLYGIDFKILDINDFITDNILDTIVSSIDFLILFSTMESHYSFKLYELADKTVFIDGERTDFNSAKKELWKNLNMVERNVIETTRRKSDLPFNWEPDKLATKLMLRWGKLPILIKGPY